MIDRSWNNVNYVQKNVVGIWYFIIHFQLFYKQRVPVTEMIKPYQIFSFNPNHFHMFLPTALFTYPEMGLIQNQLNNRMIDWLTDLLIDWVINQNCLLVHVRMTINHKYVQARGPGFETYLRRVVSLSKTLYSPKVLVNYPGSDGSVPTWLKNCWLGR